MPDIKILSLNNMPQRCKEMKHFMANHFPDKVGVLNFNKCSTMNSRLEFYFDELMEVSQRVIGELYIHNFEVSQAHLVSLLSANKHKQIFGLLDCKLDLSSVPDFGGRLAGSRIRCLDLSSSGGFSCCNWNYNVKDFENLIVGLSQEEDFLKNLQIIKMSECGMEKDVVEEILDDHGFLHVEIHGHSK
ncbi:unnamed protein product [Moneuplotes crassus]|uniref:Uncharacterized protein n=1 Tax=Euplotes crassus TaxID=5936 RepID=A0AAD1U726_EUPCR|nr:unnamed protein product [Moneuplotes crassus]